MGLLACASTALGPSVADSRLLDHCLVELVQHYRTAYQVVTLAHCEACLVPDWITIQRQLKRSFRTNRTSVYQLCTLYSEPLPNIAIEFAHLSTSVVRHYFSPPG